MRKHGLQYGQAKNLESPVALQIIDPLKIKPKNGKKIKKNFFEFSLFFAKFRKISEH